MVRPSGEKVGEERPGIEKSRCAPEPSGSIDHRLVHRTKVSPAEGASALGHAVWGSPAMGSRLVTRTGATGTAPPPSARVTLKGIATTETRRSRPATGRTARRTRLGDPAPGPPPMDRRHRNRSR